jgi:DNA invertase Pin-like site-specific DNA recombinase
VLGSLAQFERSLILARTKEGRVRARANGVRFGRKRKLTAFQVKTAKTMRELGSSFQEIGRTLGVAHTTVSRSLGEG